MSDISIKLRSLMFILFIVVFCVSIGVTISLLADRSRFFYFAAGFLAIPIVFFGLVSIPTAWTKICSLLRQIRWWHILWILLFISGQTFRVRTTESIMDSPFDMAAFFRIGLISLIMLLLLSVSLIYRISFNQIFRGLIGLLTLYSLIGIASTLWSVYPLWSFYKSAEYFVGIILIGVIISRIRLEKQIKTLFDLTWLLLVVLLGSVFISVIIWPENSIKPIPGGLGFLIMGLFPYVAHEGIGQTAAVLLIVSINRLLFLNRYSVRSFVMYLMTCILFFVILIIAQSRSALFAALVAAALLFWKHGKISIYTFGMLILVLLLSLTSFETNLTTYLLRGQSEEQFRTLSSRIFYWELALAYFSQQPFLGYGAYTGGRFLGGEMFGETFSSFHNTWVETAIGVGIIGLMPLVISVLLTWKFLIFTLRNKRNEVSKGGGDHRLIEMLRIEAIGVMAILTVRSFFQLMFIWHPANLWLLVLGYTELLRRRDFSERLRRRYGIR